MKSEFKICFASYMSQFMLIPQICPGNMYPQQEDSRQSSPYRIFPSYIPEVLQDANDDQARSENVG